MKLEIIRTFHPIGQGAFYSEEFKDENGEVRFRVVYDCGCRHGATDQAHGIRTLRTVMANWQKNNHPGIDYLFISHFDFDHVSLLRIVKEKHVNVGRVILPLLEPNEKATLRNFYEGAGDWIVSKCLLPLVEDPTLELDAKVVWVKPLKADVVLSNDDFKDDGARIMEVMSGTRFPVIIRGVGLDWRYIPCNYDDKNRGRDFRDKLSKEFGQLDLNTLADFPQLMKYYAQGKNRAFGKLKAVYDSVEGKINENSMTVYSGPVGQKLAEGRQGGCPIISCENAECPVQRKFPCVIIGDSEMNVETCGGSACVYTGDVDLKVAKIDEWYKDFWNQVGTIQVPHHGSRLSFDSSPFSGGKYLCPISCSDRCYYKHPHACVTNALVTNGNIPIRVTESIEFHQVISVSQ